MVITFGKNFCGSQGGVVMAGAVIPVAPAAALGPDEPERGGVAPGGQAGGKLGGHIASLSEDDTGRFWAVVDRVTGPVHPELGRCWIWTAGTYKPGYGWFAIVRGPARRKRAAHRISYFLFHGRLDVDKVVRHRCDNPPCVNPAHLVAGTRADNSADMVERGRSASGERCPSAVLSEVNVMEIRRRRALGETTVALSSEFGVDKSLISQIAKGKIWRHLPLATAAEVRP